MSLRIERETSYQSTVESEWWNIDEEKILTSICIWCLSYYTIEDPNLKMDISMQFWASIVWTINDTFLAKENCD